MSKHLVSELKKKLDVHDYMSGIARSTKRVKSTAEIFTPNDLVIDIITRIPKSLLSPERKILDPACGDGQFLVAVKWYRVITFKIDEHLACEGLYGVDLMRDNVDLCKERLLGGEILMGDSLNPARRLKLQTNYEYQRVNELLEDSSQLTLFT